MTKEPNRGDTLPPQDHERACQPEFYRVPSMCGPDVYYRTMPTAIHREEIEIKLRIADVVALRKRLKQLRAHEISPRTYESNTLYDTPKKDLRRRGQLIRIRIERPASSFGKARLKENAAAILTYKGPARRSPSGPSTRQNSNIRNHFKIRDEAEVSVTGGTQLPRILRALGLLPAFRYEKFRTTYALPGIRGLKIELDETPVGTYLELEGPVSAIDRGARLLGYTRQDFIKETYGSLYLSECRRRGQKPADMLFPPTKKLAERALFP
jgi:adenylate cyclase, class 2